MKLLKILFSKAALIAISVIIQVLIFVIINVYLYESYIVFYWIFTVLSILILLFIINKEKPASFKLPWICLVLLFPIVGLTLYILFGNFSLTRKQKAKLEEESSKLKEYVKQEHTTIDGLYKIDKDAYGQVKYIASTCYLPTYDNSDCEYLATGEIFFEKLKDKLSDAKKFIFMEYFIVEEGKMFDSIFEILKEKVKEGIEVYFMYDDIGCVGKINSSFKKKLEENGIIVCRFSPFRPFVSAIHNNRDHRKITVIDGEYSFVGGINLADEYINETHPYGVWKDNAVLLKGECVNSLSIIFLQLFNANSDKKVDSSLYINRDYKKYKNEGFITPYCSGPYPIYNEYISEQVYLNLINSAKDYLYITTPYLIVDYHFIEALINASKRGVDVRIITPYIPDKKIIKIMTKGNYHRLIRNGVNIYEYKYGFIHSKMIIVDDKYASVGTVNLDYRSFVHHYECGVHLYNCDAIFDMKDDFDDLIINKTIKIDETNAKLNFFERILKNILELFAPLM